MRQFGKAFREERRVKTQRDRYQTDGGSQQPRCGGDAVNPGAQMLHPGIQELRCAFRRISHFADYRFLASTRRGRSLELPTPSGASPGPASPLHCPVLLAEGRLRAGLGWARSGTPQLGLGQKLQRQRAQVRKLSVSGYLPLGQRPVWPFVGLIFSGLAFGKLVSQ